MNDWKWSLLSVAFVVVACVVLFLMLRSCLVDTGWSLLTCLWVSG